MTTDILDLSTLRLDSGGHDSRDSGVFLMEAVAWFAGQSHTDHPPCVSAAIAAFGRIINDRLPDDLRQELIPLIPLMVGTADPEQDKADAFKLADWAVRTIVPIALKARKLQAEADKLRALKPIVDKDTAIKGKTAAYAADAAAYAAADAAADAANARTKIQRLAIDFFSDWVRERAVIRKRSDSNA